jgi:nicotinate-nucleotide adenylyltransferase
MLLIGGDNLQKFRHWKDFQRIIDQFGLLVYPRALHAENPFGNHRNIRHFIAPLLDISSSDIRNRLIENRSVTGMLPDEVAQFLQQKYRTDPQKPVF